MIYINYNFSKCDLWEGLNFVINAVFYFPLSNAIKLHFNRCLFIKLQLEINVIAVSFSSSDYHPTNFWMFTYIKSMSEFLLEIHCFQMQIESIAWNRAWSGVLKLMKAVELRYLGYLR